MTTEKAVTVRETPIELTPREVVDNATIQAKLLMDIVEKTRCFQTIANKKYLQVEAWETIGAFNRTHAETESIHPIKVNEETVGYQAHVQLWKDGKIVGGAIMPCYFTENCCKGKEGDAKHKACVSAAQTFATSKAYRMNYSYVAILAGYEPTPAEEMAETENQSEHLCELHQTNFFKKGKMKSYAHPIGDTGEWCHEHKSTTEVTQEVEQASEVSEVSQAEIQPEGTLSETESGIFIDMDWLKASMKKIKWTPNTASTWLVGKYKVKGGLLEKVLTQLTHEQQEEFAEEIFDRLEML